jgi:hypothetical protein
VDHITVWEHSKDLIIPKFVLRALIEFGLGFISSGEIKYRLLSLIKNRWNQIEDLMVFDRQHGIPSTFFIGVNNGKYLSYGKDIARYWINRVRSQGLDAGVHGIEYDDFKAMTDEHSEFKQMSGLNAFGIRMHYLQRAPDTIEFLSRIGYAFDSTEMAIINPYKIGDLWEFPLHVMDGHVLCHGKRWQDRNLEQARQETKECIEQALDTGINYFTLLFHDRYFYDGFKSWKDWYIWFVEYCKENGLDFISYTSAIEEMTQCEPN